MMVSFAALCVSQQILFKEAEWEFFPRCMSKHVALKVLKLLPAFARCCDTRVNMFFLLEVSSVIFV